VEERKRGTFVPKQFIDKYERNNEIKIALSDEKVQWHVIIFH